MEVSYSEEEKIISISWTIVSPSKITVLHIVIE
jgi:hypothetical protein